MPQHKRSCYGASLHGVFQAMLAVVFDQRRAEVIHGCYENARLHLTCTTTQVSTPPGKLAPRVTPRALEASHAALSSARTAATQIHCQNQYNCHPLFECRLSCISAYNSPDAGILIHAALWQRAAAYCTVDLSACWICLRLFNVVRCTMQSSARALARGAVIRAAIGRSAHAH